MATNSDKCPIFLSYQWDNQAEVKRLKECLTSLGYNAWMDINKLNVGNSLSDTISEAIREADIFIACITRKYVESKMCSKEIHYAATNQKKILPLMFEDLSHETLKGVGFIIADTLHIKMKQTVDIDWSGEYSAILINEIEKNIRKSSIEESCSNLKIVEEITFKKVKYENGEMYEGEVKKDKRDGKGVLIYSNGDKYEGEFKNDMKHGKGVLIYANGDKYDGEFSNDKKHGKGVLLYSNRSKYEGEFRDDKRHGTAVMVYAAGAVTTYIGEFKDDKRNGLGHCYNVQETYTGEFKDDKRNGKGFISSLVDGDYNGDFKDDFANGIGDYCCDSQVQIDFGGKYRGEVKNWQLYGRGSYVYKGKFQIGYFNGCFVGQQIYTLENGEKFAGDIDTGKGLFIDSNGNYYNKKITDELLQDLSKHVTFENIDFRYIDLEFENDVNEIKKLHDRYKNNYKPDNGRGVWTNENGDKYVGDFKNGMPHGKGRLALASGTSYDGDFVDGKPNGICFCKFENGGTYNGGIENGKKHGNGHYINGSMHEFGYFENDAFVSGQIYTQDEGWQHVNRNDLNNNLKQKQFLQ